MKFWCNEVFYIGYVFIDKGFKFDFGKIYVMLKIFKLMDVVGV